MQIVNFNEVMRLIQVKNGINRIPLEEIEWVRDDGSKIEFDSRLTEEWKFMGMSNVHFVELFLARVVAGEQKELLKELAWQPE